MGNGDNRDPQLAVQDRIASFMQAEQSRRKQVTDEERQALRHASVRLQQLLTGAVEADVKILSAAALRLDQLLADIAEGKDVAIQLKQRRRRDIPE